MSVMGLCHVCSDPASRTCEGCGQAVCGDHYDASSGRCHRCERGRTV